MRGKAPKCLQRGKTTLSLFQNLRNVQAKQRALSKTSCNVYDMLRKYHHHHSSFWHLLYDNNQWKISNWSEIISWCIFAQSRLYAFLKKHFPEITTIACRTKIPCVCVLKICIELYLLPSSPRLLYFRCMTTLVCLDAFSHTYRNINISNHKSTPHVPVLKIEFGPPHTDFGSVWSPQIARKFWHIQQTTNMDILLQC